MERESRKADAAELGDAAVARIPQNRKSFGFEMEADLVLSSGRDPDPCEKRRGLGMDESFGNLDLGERGLSLDRVIYAKGRKPRVPLREREIFFRDSVIREPPIRQSVGRLVPRKKQNPGSLPIDAMNDQEALSGKTLGQAKEKTRLVSAIGRNRQESRRFIQGDEPRVFIKYFKREIGRHPPEITCTPAVFGKKVSPLMKLLRSLRFWLVLTGSIAIMIGSIAYLSRGPDFPIEWSREVPSKHTPAELAPALQDIRYWPVFHHALKDALLYAPGDGKLSRDDVPLGTFDRFEVGQLARFRIEPKGKEWKRFQIMGEITQVETGRRLAFRMTDESSGKTKRLLADFRWGVSVREATEAEKLAGHRAFVRGEATAVTKNARSRFFGRIAAKILMNQIYQIDLVRLANFEANQESWAKDYAPVYR